MHKAERLRAEGDVAGTLLTPRRRLAFGLGLALVFCWSVALLMPHTISPASKPLAPISTPGELEITAPNEQQQQDETNTPTQNLQVSDVYSVKPIAYIFPQFHAIPENDKFWGANFTEWTFVKTATKNRFGQDVLRPEEDVGYYNLLDLETRTRYADLLREMGFYGICYHHYWFEGPIMDKALFALMEDGQPDVPFMLSWANEPWTKHWDGQDSSETLLKQEYGDLHNWRRHFEYLMQFFEHPLYIRVNGKPQFVAYNLGHMGVHAQPMFAAFKQWALEAGLPGLDIIQTKDAGISNRGDADAINEFHPRSSGSLDQTSFAGLRRISRVYHRGLLVGFDNTPRHQTDGSARINPWTHPDLWKQSVLSVIGHIKKDPNPPGEENFLFINALNEWGEGNVLEPTIQWDRRFPTAFREAVEEAKAIPWRQDLIQQGYQLETELASAGEPAVDVCVLVRTFRHDWAFEYPWTLWDHLRSLQEQRNPRWRAVVYSVVPHEGFVLRNTIKDTFDPRIQYAEAPGSVFDAKGDPVVQGWNATKWVLGDLGTISPACHGAKYIMIADSNTTLAAHTFDEASTATDDIVGLNFVSEESMRMDQDKPMTWDQRCTRFLDVSLISAANILTRGNQQLTFLFFPFFHRAPPSSASPTRAILSSTTSPRPSSARRSSCSYSRSRARSARRSSPRRPSCTCWPTSTTGRGRTPRRRPRRPPRTSRRRATSSTAGRTRAARRRAACGWTYRKRTRTTGRAATSWTASATTSATTSACSTWSDGRRRPSACA